MKRKISFSKELLRNSENLNHTKKADSIFLNVELTKKILKQKNFKKAKKLKRARNLIKEDFQYISQN